MIEKWFFEKFELITDATGSVAKMRELVLELGVQGKLVPQEPKDESATLLLKRIQADANQTGRRRGVRRKDTEVDVVPPYLLPNNWTWTTLGSIADWGSGSTPPRGNYELYGGNVTWLKSGELNDNRALVDSEERVTESALKHGSFRHNKPGDVLFAMYGATVGKVAILAEPAVTNQAVCGCTPVTGVLNHFLFFYLVSQRQRFRNASEGGAQPNFSKDKIVAYPFPLPPLAEQKRIVAKVDELIALCDQLDAQQRERATRKSVLVRASLARFSEAPTPANLGFLFHKSYDIPPAELRKSILTLAVQGNLVSQDLNDEPASSILVRIESEKALLVKQKAIRASNAHTTRDVDRTSGVLPVGWAWAFVDELASVGTGSTPLKSNNEFYANGDVPWVTSAATNNEFIHAPEQFVTRKAVKDCNLRIYPKGSLLIALYGQGKTRGQVGQLMFDSTTNQACAVLEFFGTGESVRDYIRLFFLKKYDELREQAAGGAQPNLSGGMIRLTRVPLPPLAEQRRIVAKVDQLMALVVELESQLNTSRTTASQLLDAIVYELTKRN